MFPCVISYCVRRERKRFVATGKIWEKGHCTVCAIICKGGQITQKYGPFTEIMERKKHSIHVARTPVHKYVSYPVVNYYTYSVQHREKEMYIVGITSGTFLLSVQYVLVHKHSCCYGHTVARAIKLGQFCVVDFF